MCFFLTAYMTNYKYPKLMFNVVVVIYRKRPSFPETDKSIETVKKKTKTSTGFGDFSSW